MINCRLDLTGKKYSKLSAVKFSHIRKNRSYWFFQCDCGKIFSCDAREVKRGRRHSCGMCYKNKQLTKDILKYFIIYNKKTGMFKYINNKNEIIDAGVIGNRGYIIIHIAGKPYLAHRLAWLYIYGYLPENGIDHINKKKDDNRICNLREVSQSCNMRNSSLSIRNKSGVKGVTYCKHKGLWVVQMTVNYRRLYFGAFNNITEAAAHRLAAEQCYNWNFCESDSTAFKHIEKYIKTSKSKNMSFKGE